MLAVFTKIMNSKKLSGPRLEINLKGITRNSDCCCERIASIKRKKPKVPAKRKEKTKKTKSSCLTSCCERIANNKRVIDRNRVMLKEKEAKSIRCLIL